MLRDSTGAEHTLPPQVRQLIERHLRSAAEIEILLLLYRSPETFWAPSAVATVAHITEQEARAHLSRFESAHLIERAHHADAFRFAPAAADDRCAIEALAAAYAEHRDLVLRAVIGSLSQITAFSDAFRFPR